MSFAHKIEEPKLSGVGRNNIFEYLLFKMPLGKFAHKIGESGLSGAGRNHIFEYLLVEMPLGRHRNTQFDEVCT